MEGAVQHFEVPVPDFTFSVYPAGEHQLTTASAGSCLPSTRP